jgi:hypothetical protein
MAGTPAAEVEIDAALIQALLEEQHSHLVTCRLSADQSRLRKWRFRDWLLTVVA